MISKEKAILFVLLLLLVLAIALFCMPILQSPTNAYIEGNIATYYNQHDIIEIDTVYDWQLLTQLSFSYSFLEKTIVLNCDIDLGMYPCLFSNFEGTFEGNNFSIFNANGPLFNIIYEDAKVQNIHFYNTNLIDHDALILTNNGLIENVTSHGYIENFRASGLVHRNNGIIKNTISYLTIKDNAFEDVPGDIGGITHINSGEIIDSHYIGKQILSTYSNAGGIAFRNLGTIKRCSSRIDIEIQTEKSIDNLKVGGIVGVNGQYDEATNETYVGYINNCFSILNVKYLTEIDFEERDFSFGGIIGESQYTVMSHCYSDCYVDIDGEATFFGIVDSTLATPIMEEVEGNQTVIGYDFHGTAQIEHCFSTHTLIPTIKWGVEGNFFDEVLPESNAKIDIETLLNRGANSNLIDLLSYENNDTCWRAESGQYPVFLQILEGQGTAQQPFLIKSKEDIFRLQAFFYNQPLEYYFLQTAEIDFYYTQNLPFDLQMCFVGYYDGSDFAIHNYNSSALFHKNIGAIENLGFINGTQENTIVIENDGNIDNCYTDTALYSYTTYNNDNIYNGRAYTQSETFGYTGEETLLPIEKHSFDSGDGTQEDPYAISTPNQLANLGIINSNQYVILNNDILVNCSTQTDKWQLGNSGFNGFLDGNGHSIIGLVNEPLVKALTGTIINLNIRGIRSVHDNAGLLTDEIGEYGRVENVTIYGSIAKAQSGGIAFSNAGNIVSCVNYSHVYGQGSAGICALNYNNIEMCLNRGESTYGIASNNMDGAIRNCMDNSNSLYIYNEEGQISSTLQKIENEIVLWHNSQEILRQETLHIDELREYEDYDFGIYGYEVGIEDYPTIKIEKRFYKQDIAQQFFNSDIRYNRVYDRFNSYEFQQIEEGITISDIKDFVEYQWSYNDCVIDTLQTPNIKNAGVYKVYAKYLGSHYINSYTYIHTITISKATLPDTILDTDIRGISTPYIYDGDIYDISSIKVRDEYGISLDDYSFTIKLNNKIKEHILEVGQYSVGIKIVTNNYRDKTLNTIVTISKANLDIFMESYEIAYLSEVPVYEYYFELQTNEDATEEQKDMAIDRATMAIADANGTAYCSYQQEDNVGEYEISFAVSLENYNVIIHKGILTVEIIDLPSENIVFENSTKVYTGSIICHYVEVDDESIDIEYFNNSNKDVGEYEIIARLSNPNYKSLELSAFLTIEKATLTIKAEDKTIEYNQDPPEYNLAEIIFLGEDDISCLSGEITYQCDYIKGNNVGDYDIIILGYEAENYSIDFINGKLTVNEIYMTDIFTFDDVTYTYDGQPKSHLIDIFDYQVNVTYYYYLDEMLLDEPIVNANTYGVKATVESIDINYIDTDFYAIMTVSKADLDVYVLEEYAFEYNGEGQNINYQGSLPQNEEYTISQIGYDENENEYYSFRDTGVYYVSISFTNNINYNDLMIDTILVISPKVLEISVESAEYCNQNIEPTATFIGEIFENDTIELSWQYQLLGDSSKVSTIRDAGTYTCFITSENTNYTIANNPEFVINSRNINITFQGVEFIYGQYNEDFEYNNNTYYCTKTYVIQKEYYIFDLREYIDIKYFYNGQDGAGRYPVVSIEDTRNYTFSLLESEQDIVVLQRSIEYQWNIISPYQWQNENNDSVTAQYTGKEHKPFSIIPLNLVANDEMTISLTNNQNKDVGIYQIGAEIKNEIAKRNYKLSVIPVTLKITKAPLTIKVDDKEAIKGTEHVSFTYTTAGLQNGETLTSLGVAVAYSFEYKHNTPIGTYNVGIIEFSLHNYEITFVDGEFIVTPNPTPPLTLPDRTFVYDGVVKRLSLPNGLPEEATTIDYDYGDTVPINVGAYAVIAKVSFRNHTVQWLTATLTIIKANPDLIIEDVSLPYYRLAKLENSDIIGVAKVGNNIVSGTYEWKGDTALKRRINEYQITFTPDDTINIDTAVATVQVEGKIIDREIFELSSTNVIVTDDEIYINEKTTLSIKEWYPNLELYLDNVACQEIVLDTVGKHNIEIRFRDGVVFSNTYDVIMQDDKNLEPALPPDTEKFQIRGGIINDDDTIGRIMIEGEQVIVEINETYRKDMELFLNGEKVPFIVFDGTQERATIEIKYKGILVYSKSFIIKVAPTLQEGDSPYNWKWIIIFASVLGGIGFVVLLLFITRKALVAQRRGYNPYEVAERRRQKTRKKFK